MLWPGAESLHAAPVPWLSPLASAESAYLRSQAGSRVHWLPWGEEAFKLAEKEGKPVFVSIGYFTCHWCSLMHRESFDTPEGAAFLNENFVNVLVDRFERPDLDRLFLRYALRAIKKNGWPLNVWLTPKGLPFRAVTFLPAENKGNGTFARVAEHTARSWTGDSEHITAQVASASADFEWLERPENHGLSSRAERPQPPFQPAPATLDAAAAAIAGEFDPVSAGFGRAPKFPPAARLEVLARSFSKYQAANPDRAAEARRMIAATLTSMARGGIHDQIDGGFFRYSLDEAWRRPYFEKLLTDQAEISLAFLTGWQVTGNEEFARSASSALHYALAELAAPGGGFWNGEHCESLPPGAKSPVEGAYYAWQAADFATTAGAPAAKLLTEAFGIRDGGNLLPGPPPLAGLENPNIPYLALTREEAARRSGLPEAGSAAIFAEGVENLRRARGTRPRPPLDRILVASGNGRMISALARAGTALGEPALVESAVRCASFIRRQLAAPDDSVLFHSCLDRPGTLPATSEDYASVISGLLDLYSATGHSDWLSWAARLQEKMNTLFRDPANDGYFDAQEGASGVYARLKPFDDAAATSANALAARNLLRLGAILNRPDLTAQAGRLVTAFPVYLNRAPGIVPGLALAADLTLEPFTECVLTGPVDAPDCAAVRHAWLARYRPEVVLVHLDPADEAGRKLLGEKNPALSQSQFFDGQPSATLCRGFVPLEPSLPAARLADRWR